MKPVLFTMYEKDYHYGVAALVNSAIRCGYKGAVCVSYRGELPPWTQILPQTAADTFQVGSCSLSFRRLEAAGHPAYHKPHLALEVLNLYPDCDTVLYADPDVVFLADWSFFQSWLEQGVAFCLDANFPYLPAEHPWRKTWAALLHRATGKASHPLSYYPNSGFFSVRRQDMAFLQDWQAITEKYRQEQGELTTFRLTERHLPITGDQDLMAATLMGWEGESSILGPEGMGFTGHHFILSHDISQPKAWRRNFWREALKGEPTPRAAELFLDFINHPIPAWSEAELRQKRISLQVAKVISRVWHR